MTGEAVDCSQARSSPRLAASTDVLSALACEAQASGAHLSRFEGLPERERSDSVEVRPWGDASF